MSVLKNNRKTSRFQFEQNYTDFYTEYKEKVESISNRRMKWVGLPLLKAMSSAYISVMRVNQYLFTKRSCRKSNRRELILKAIDDVYGIEKPLFVYFDIFRTPFKKQVWWCSFLNTEITLLGDLLSMKQEELPQFIAIDWEAVKKMVFLQTMCEIHRTIHTKIIRAVDDLENTETSVLAELVDTAFYLLMLANKNFPETREQYLDREEKIDTVLQCLDDMCIPLLSYFNIMQYTEEEMNKIIDLIKTEQKLLGGLKKSDKKNFSHLK